MSVFGIMISIISGLVAVALELVSDIRKTVWGIYVTGSNIDVLHNTVSLAPGAGGIELFALVLINCSEAQVKNNILLTRHIQGISNNAILTSQGETDCLRYSRTGS